MKSKLIKIALVLLVLLIAAVVAVTLSLDSIIKKGVETVGPQVTKVEVKLDGVKLSLMSGQAGLSGLFIGNPEGFMAPSALKAGDVSVAVKRASVLADKVVVHSVIVKAPEVTIEGSLKGNNLSKLLANIEAFTASEKSAPAEKKAGKKLQVDEFEISGGKINIAISELGGRPATIPLPTIRLTALGQGPDGITAGDLSQRVIHELLKTTTTAVSGSLGELLKGATGTAKELTKDATKSAKDVTKGVTDLFKKR